MQLQLVEFFTKRIWLRKAFFDKSFIEKLSFFSTTLPSDPSESDAGGQGKILHKIKKLRADSKSALNFA